MHIVMLSWEYPPKIIGGVAPHVRDLSRALVRRGHRVTVLAGAHPESPPVADDEGVEVRRVRSPFPVPPEFVADVMQFNVALIEQALGTPDGGKSVDVVHCHDWLVAGAGRALKHIWGKPMVCTIHATEHGRNGGLHNALQRYIHGMEWRLAREASHVITCSSYMRDEVMRLFGVPGSRVDVVPNGVDREEFRLPEDVVGPLLRLKRRMRAARQTLIFFMGRLVWEKGAQDLIDALPLVRERVGGARLIVAGDGPLKEELMRRAHVRGVAPYVYFPGFISGARRRQLLALADVAVFPSRYEPFGIVALEAMASRVPVVVGDTGGLAEVVRHGVNGLKAVPGDPASIAQRIVQVLAIPHLARRLVERAYRDVERLYDWDAIAERTGVVYERVAEQQEAGPRAAGEGQARRAGDDGRGGARRLGTAAPAAARIVSPAAGRSRYYATGMNEARPVPVR